MANWIGGAFVHRDHKGDKGNRAPIEAVSAEVQRDALKWVVEYSFKDEAFGLTPAVLQRLRSDLLASDESFKGFKEATFPIHDRVMGVQSSVLTMLLNPTNPNAKTVLRDVEVAARSMGLQIQVYNATATGEIDTALAAMMRERPDGVLFIPDPVFNARRVPLVHWASRHALPAIYWQREFPEAGGLISYGSSISEAFHQVGVYAGRILKGDKVADLPVVRSDKFELVINHQAARLIGITVTPSLLTRAHQVIE